jgi:hypothetical protein
MELKKALNTVGVFSLGAGAMISSGLFILPSFAFAEAGTGAILSYLCAGLCMLPAVFTKLELTSAIPKSGGAFFYLTRIFGAPVAWSQGSQTVLYSPEKRLCPGGYRGLRDSSLSGLGEGEFNSSRVAACLLFTAVNLLSVEGTGKFKSSWSSFLSPYWGLYSSRLPKMDFSRFTAAEGFDLRRSSAQRDGFYRLRGHHEDRSAVEEVKDPKRMLVPAS